MSYLNTWKSKQKSNRQDAPPNRVADGVLAPTLTACIDKGLSRVKHGEVDAGRRIARAVCLLEADCRRLSHVELLALARLQSALDRAKRAV